MQDFMLNKLKMGNMTVPVAAIVASLEHNQVTLDLNKCSYTGIYFLSACIN